MKTKKLFITSACVLLLAVSVGIAAYAITNVPADTAQPKQSPLIDNDYKFTPDVSIHDKDENAEKTKEFTADNGEAKSLKYSYSDDNVAGVEDVDVYNDSEGNKYLYDKDGSFAGYSAQTPHDVDSVYDEKQIADIAVAEAYLLFGERFDGFELIGSFYDEATERHFLDFARLYGENGFIIGELCNMIVMSDRTVIKCTMVNEKELEGFDAALLDGITEKQIADFATTEAAKLFPDLIDFIPESVTLTNMDGRFVLNVMYDHVTESRPSLELQSQYYMDFVMSMDINQFFMSYYYPLEP